MFGVNGTLYPHCPCEEYVAGEMEDATLPMDALDYLYDDSTDEKLMPPPQVTPSKTPLETSLVREVFYDCVCSALFVKVQEIYSFRISKNMNARSCQVK